MHADFIFIDFIRVNPRQSAANLKKPPFWRDSKLETKLKIDIFRKITGQLKAGFGHFIVKYLSSSNKKG
jgi:hypothetical protein